MAMQRGQIPPDNWARVADLKPRLRPDLHIHHHRYRGVSWYVLQDRTTTQHYRFSKSAYLFVCLLNGRHSVRQIQQVLQGRLGQEAPDREQILQLLGRLHTGELLEYDVPQDAGELFARRERSRKARWRQRLLRPFAWRISLVDPDPLLERFLPWVRHLFGPAGLFLWLWVVGSALLQLPLYWGGLAERWADQALEPRNLLLILLTYPCVKLVHELGHAFATKVWGGEVHDMGIMFLWLMPVPYVDASSASAFRERHRRMLVGAMGILVELFLAALALHLWTRVDPGWTRDLAFNVLLIGGVSTVLFNGNPLLRFDGYYVLADAIEIPNLGSRSNQYLGYLWRRFLFGLSQARSPQSAPGEWPWFLFYGIASFVYRLFIVFAIALYIAGQYFVLGLVLALWALFGSILFPLLKTLGNLALGSEFKGHRVRVLSRTAALAVLAAVLIALVPMASWTRAEGVVRLPEQAHVRAYSDGFVVALHRRDGAVAGGDVLLEMENPSLLTEVSALEWKERELDARSSEEFLRDPIRLQTLRQELAGVQAELGLKRERAARLRVLSPGPGYFMAAGGNDLLGRYVAKGQTLGYLVDDAALSARVVVRQAAVDRVRNHTESVRIKIASRPDITLASSILREVPSATDQLPSKALGSLGGGDIQVDVRDAQGLHAIEKVFQFDLALPPEAPHALVGGRVHVRFKHTGETLARRWYRRGRQLLLYHLKS